VRRRGWREGAPRPIDFFDAKGAVETLLEYLKLQGEWSRGRHPSMHPGRTAVVIVDEQVVGHVGELHPIVRAAWELGDDPVAVADLDLDVLIELAAGTSASFRPYSPYPPVHQDLAVVVADNVTAADVAAVMRRVAGPLLVDVALFDVFRGGPVREGFKSLAWSLTFQAPDKTLRSKHVEKMRQRIVKALGKELGAELR
jgi:phenylalanyl-tRNA synthetase beta chain